MTLQATWRDWGGFGWQARKKNIKKIKKMTGTYCTEKDISLNQGSHKWLLCKDLFIKLPPSLWQALASPRRRKREAVNPWHQSRSTLSKPLVSPWSTPGQPLVNPWSTRGQPLVSHWSVPGQPFLKPWSNPGQPRVNPLSRPCQPPSQHLVNP